MARRYDGPIVDIDIHHGWKTWDEVATYLPKRWREYAVYRVPRGPTPGVIVFDPVPQGAMRTDTYPQDGSKPGTDYPLMKEQLLDEYDIWRGLLTFSIGHHVHLENTEFAVPFARAVHDWNADTWLTWDDRFYGVVAPAYCRPDEAAAEIRRVGGHPRIVAVLMAGNPFGRPFGDPVYHPIYEAAVEMGLTIDIHPASVTAERLAGGKPLGNTGVVPLGYQKVEHHITSFIVHGVFEKYPELKVVCKEQGQSWLPPLLWRLDANYELLKLESPWVKRWPSEYFLDHIWINTQPIDESPNPSDLAKVLTVLDGIDDRLMFATDYPHLSSDEPQMVLRRFPREWARKIMCDNACAFYGWTPPTEDAALPDKADDLRVA